MDDSPAIGNRLREARQKQGLEISECADATRIRERYLVAIEDGRFESLPDPAYVNGFVRAYAAHLGLTIEGPVRELPADPAPPGRSRSRPVRLSATRVTARGVGARPPWWRRPVVLLVALVIVVALGLWLGAIPVPE